MVTSHLGVQFHWTKYHLEPGQAKGKPVGTTPGRLAGTAVDSVISWNSLSLTPWHVLLLTSLDPVFALFALVISESWQPLLKALEPGTWRSSLLTIFFPYSPTLFTPLFLSLPYTLVISLYNLILQIPTLVTSLLSSLPSLPHALLCVWESAGFRAISNLQASPGRSLESEPFQYKRSGF